LRICRKINQLYQSSCYTSSKYYTTQNNPWICRYRFNGKVFLIFFLYHFSINRRSFIESSAPDLYLLRIVYHYLSKWRRSGRKWGWPI
jgi:hypothetical protein